MEIFNREKALELVDGDESLLEILVDAFKNENKFEKSELNSLVDSGKMKEAAGYVHATKGAARQLCMEKLQESGQALEDVLRGKAQGDVKKLTDIMAEDYAEVLRLLEN